VDAIAYYFLNVRGKLEGSLHGGIGNARYDIPLVFLLKRSKVQDITCINAHLNNHLDFACRSRGQVPDHEVIGQENIVLCDSVLFFMDIHSDPRLIITSRKETLYLPARQLCIFLDHCYERAVEDVGSDAVRRDLSDFQFAAVGRLWVKIAKRSRTQSRPSRNGTVRIIHHHGLSMEIRMGTHPPPNSGTLSARFADL
jgi:hypothetical protein